MLLTVAGKSVCNTALLQRAAAVDYLYAAAPAMQNSCCIKPALQQHTQLA
jgi:hypothetical protein